MSQRSEPKLLRRLYFFFFLIHSCTLHCLHFKTTLPWCHSFTLKCSYLCMPAQVCISWSVLILQCRIVWVFFGSWDIRPAFIRNFIGCVEAFGALRIIQTFQPRQLLMLIESLKGTFWPCRSIVFASIQVYIFCWIPFRLLKCTHHFL